MATAMAIVRIMCFSGAVLSAFKSFHTGKTANASGIQYGIIDFVIRMYTSVRTPSVNISLGLESDTLERSTVQWVVLVRTSTLEYMAEGKQTRVVKMTTTRIWREREARD